MMIDGDYMKKMFVFFLSIYILFPLNVFATTFPSYKFKSGLVYDATDDVMLYELNSNDKASIASLTKITTIMTAIENIEDLDKKVKITYNILATVDPEASVAGLRAGDVVTYRDLLYATMLPSGADAANALAILSSGSIKAFVEKMNAFSQKVELSNTHYVDVTGLASKDQFSTASDINKLLLYSLQNETFKQIYTAKKYTLSNGLKVESTLYKYNKGNDTTLSKILGSKTGFTDEAGYCMASLANISNHDIIIIVLNDKETYQLKDTISIIDFIEDNYQEQELISKGTKIIQLPVVLSKIKIYDINTSKDIKRLLPKDFNNDSLKSVYDGIDTLSYKIPEGKEIGEIKYYYDDILYATEEVFAPEIKPTLIEWIKSLMNKNIFFKIIGIILLLFLGLVVLFGLLLIVLIIRKKIRKNLRKKHRKKKKKR